MRVFVPPDDAVKIVWLEVENVSARPRRVTATYYAEWVLGSDRQATRPHIRSEAVREEACLLAGNSWSLDFADRVAFLASDARLHGFTTDRTEFLGQGHDLSHPAALFRLGLSGRVDPGVDPSAALQVHLDIPPAGSAQVCFFLGQANDRDGALDAVRALREPGAVERAWRARGEWWDARLDAVVVRTPDPSMDRLLNRWLMYQTLASRFLGRTAFYQSSGAFGFRDQLQDALALLHVAPSMTRAHLLEVAAHQFVEGDVLHWWHPPGGAGVRTRCSDDLLWLVYTTADYVEATGDVSILDEEVPFLVAEELRPGENTRFSRFASGESGTLLTHCRRALTRGFTRGPRGLPLIGDGDWNDGMNRVGLGGRGESVWLGWFVHACTTRFARLLERIGDPGEAERWRARLLPLVEALEEHAWDGAWYQRAYHDDGTPIGSSHTAPPHIDSIAQSWAALSGAALPDRALGALEAVDHLLVREEDRLVLLLSPPFGKTGPDPGYIAAYPAGVRENGGQYTHAAAWVGWAHAALGDGARAHRIFDLLNPLARTKTSSEVERYRVEPYVIAADVYGRAPFVGRGGWTWYTGAAAWTWRLGVEAILGLRREAGSLVVDPCIPATWDGFEAWIKQDDLTIHVVVDNASGRGRGVAEARLDGARLSEARVELRGSGQRRLEIVLGAPAHGFRQARASW
jgi:cyclic beta-1,2-glucan synthetase